MPGTPRHAKPAELRRRRNATPGFRQLPAEGRKGAPPAFPLVDPTEAESTLWATLWKLPQAVEWERLEYTRVVGRYVRMVIATEEDPKVAMLAEVRQMEDRLGLTPRSLIQLHWEIADPEHSPMAPARTSVVAPYVPRVKDQAAETG